MDIEKRMKRMIYFFVAICFMLGLLAMALRVEYSRPVEPKIKFKRILTVKPLPTPKLIEPEVWRIK